MTGALPAYPWRHPTELESYALSLGRMPFFSYLQTSQLSAQLLGELRMVGRSAPSFVSRRRRASDSRSLLAHRLKLMETYRAVRLVPSLLEERLAGVCVDP